MRADLLDVKPSIMCDVVSHHIHISYVCMCAGYIWCTARSFEVLEEPIYAPGVIACMGSLHTLRPLLASIETMRASQISLLRVYPVCLGLA